MYLVNYNGNIKEIYSFDECPQGEYVFTKKKDAEDFADSLLDSKIAAHQKHIDDMKAKKHKKDK